MRKARAAIAQGLWLASAMLLSPMSVAHGKDPEPLAPVTPVTKSDPNWERIQKVRKSVENPKPDYGAGYRVESIGTFQCAAQKRLFPKWRFYQFEVRMFAKKGFEGKVHIALRLEHTLAISPDAKTVVRLGNGSKWMELLNATDVKITDSKSAKLVWDAYCESHRRRWKGYGMKRESASVWRLGISSYDQTISNSDGVRVVVKRTHHTRVAVHPKTKRINEWKELVETSDRREVPTK